MRRTMPIFYSALMLTGVNLLLRVVSTSFQVFLSGRIGASGIGLLQLVLSIGSLAMTAGIAGIRTTAMYLTAEELGKGRPGHVTWVISGCTIYSLFFSCCIGSGLYIFAPLLAQHWIGDARAMESIRLFASFLPVCCLTGVMVGYFTAANRIGTLAAVEVAEQAISMAVTVGLLYFWVGNNPEKACIAVVTGSGIGACLTLICLIVLRTREGAPTANRILIAQRLKQTALPLALADDLKAGITTTENLMVPKRLALFPGTTNSLALFGTICGMVFPLLMFPACILYGLTELLIPELARCNATGSAIRIQYLVRRSLRIAMLYGAICSGVLFLCSHSICIKLYHSPEAGNYLRWFSLLAVMLYCDIITDAIIKGLGQQKYSVRYNIITSLMDLALLYVLLPRYGVPGYFLSFVVTHAVNFILSLRRLIKITGQKLPYSIPILTTSAIIGSIYAAQFFDNPFLRASAFVALLFSLLSLLGILKKEDFLWLKGVLRFSQHA